MIKKVLFLFAAALMGLALPAASQAKTFYWISHGSPADPVWTEFLQGAQKWATTTHNTVHTSFHSGDVPSQQEAVEAAIAAKAAAIITTSPDPGSMKKVVKEAHQAGIPVINFNTPDPTAGFDAYVGGNNVQFGHDWAEYLVAHHLVKRGDFVWMPVEVLGATYGVQEEQGAASVFKPLGITWEVTDETLDQATIISRMVDYIAAHRHKINAIMGLGDLVMGSIKRVYNQADVKPGTYPVVGWGDTLDTVNEVLEGYVNAAQWQAPQATSFLALSLGLMASDNIPAHYTITTGQLYTKATADTYLKLLSSMSK